MKILKTSLLLSFLISICISCKKETEEPPTVNGLPQLKKITLNSVIVEELAYNSDSTIHTITTYENDGSFSSRSTFIYNQSYLPVKVINEYSDVSFNTYDTCYYNTTNQVFRIGTVIDGIQQYVRLIHYDHQGRPDNINISYSGGMMDYNYVYGTNHNPQKLYTGGDFVCDTTYYIYDNKRNIKIKGFPAIDADYFADNNITQQIHNDPNGAVKPADSYNSVFEYNSDNLPVKETRTYLNNLVRVYEYFYN
jgi:hypothetical protein